MGNCGKKEGVHGVDNGFIIFKDHRIPKKNLLNRFSDVKDDGTFVSSIKSIDQRFAFQLGALSTGRLFSLIATSSGMCHALKITLRFCTMRHILQRKDVHIQTPLIDHQLLHFKLLPYVAHTFAAM